MKKIWMCLLLAALLIPACAPTIEPDCALPEVFCVGLVTDGGKITDQAFNQAVWEGMQLAKTKLDARVAYIETADWKDYYKNITAFADVNYDVIVTVGFSLSEATTQAAKEYPKLYFIGVDQTQPNKKLKNLTGLIFPDDQAGFLAGALAAQLTKSGKIGAVFPSDGFTYIWRLGEGYRAGAHYIKPELEVEISYHNNTSPGASFSDPEWGATSAVALVEQGADIIFSAGEKTGQGALVGTVQAGALGIGSDFDQYYALPEAQKGLVTSILKLVTPGVFSLIEAAQDGEFPGGNFTGQVNYASFHSLKNQVPDNVKANLNKVRAALLDGSLKTNVPATKP